MKKQIVVLLCVVCLAAVVGLLYGQSQDKEPTVSDRLAKVEKDYANLLLRMITLESKVKKLESTTGITEEEKKAEEERKQRDAEKKEAEQREKELKAEEKREEKREAAFTVTLVKKGFRPANYSVHPIVPDANTLTVSFVNRTGKNVRAFDGYFRFTDVLGNTIYKASVAINDPVASGMTLVWNGEISYNQFKDEDRAWRNAELKNVKIEFVWGKILFADGKTWEK